MSTKALAAHMLDAAALLEANLNSAVAEDFQFSKLVSHIGAGRGLGLNQFVADMQNPVPPVLVNPTTGRFANAAPVAGPQGSLAALNAQFAGTFPAQATAAAAQWTSTAESISSAVAALEGVKAALASSATTSWVQAAIDRINRIQWAGGTYSAHAGALAMHTTNLATVAQANQINTAVAHGTWLALPTPPAKIAFEQAYLLPFAPSLTAGLIPSNPAFDQLLPPLSDMPGGDFDAGAVSVPQAPEFDQTPLPKVVASALRERGFGDLAGANTPAQVVERFANTTPEALEAISAGATPTQVASLGVPTMPPSLNPGTGMGTGLGNSVGTPTLGGAPSVAPLNGGALGGGSPASLVGGGPMALGGPTGTSRGNTPGLGRGFAVGGGVPTGAFGGRIPSGGIAGVGMPGAGVSGTGAHGVGAPGAGTSGAGARSASAIPVGQTGTSGGNRAYPVGGHAGGGPRRSDRKGKPIKAVTSAVEREGNLRALLGEAPALLPQVIGDNVREPRER